MARATRIVVAYRRSLVGKVAHDAGRRQMKLVRRVTSVVATLVIGTILIVAGLVMLVTPGPGLLAIAAGLAVLAREFRWARRLLARVRARITEQVRRTRRVMTPGPRAYSSPDEEQRAA